MHLTTKRNTDVHPVPKIGHISQDNDMDPKVRLNPPLNDNDPERGNLGALIP